MKTQNISLTGNQLKIIALIAMTCDHIGVQLFPQCVWLRVVGRLAFPIFAYMIAEGCRYTKHKGRYLGLMVALAVVCQVVYFVAMESMYQCILVTFSLSIMMIYAADYARTKKNTLGFFLMLAVFIVVVFLTVYLPTMLKNTDYGIDYGLFGVLLPLFISIGERKRDKLMLSAVVLAGLAFKTGWVQWWSLGAIPLLALYNGQRGSIKMKYFFYIYYPAHLVAIYLLSFIIK